MFKNHCWTNIKYPVGSFVPFQAKWVSIMRSFFIYSNYIRILDGDPITSYMSNVTLMVLNKTNLNNNSGLQRFSHLDVSNI